MKEYHLKRLNDQLRALAIILAMPLLFGILTIRTAWSDPFWGKAGLILVILSLLGMIVSWFNMSKSYILVIDGDTLIVRHKKSTKEKKYNINDVALIQYNKSTDFAYQLINYIKNLFCKGVENPYVETILIFSSTGKGIFVCSNIDNSTEFNQFFSDICYRINAKEKLIYGKETIRTMGVMSRYLYINPLYENSSVVKKKTRQSGFYFPIIVYFSVLIPFIIAFNLLSIYGPSSFLNPSSPKNFKYEGISFQREYYWKFKTNEITKGKTYYIDGNNYSSSSKNEEYSSSITITISIDTNEESPQEYIENYLEDIKNAEPDSKIEEIKTGKFGNYDCVLANYSYHVDGVDFYAAIYAFSTNDNSISIVKQSGRKLGLLHDFMSIEKTFKVK